MKRTLLIPALGVLLLFYCKKEENPPANCPDCPSITTLTPNFGSPGDTITITGKNFGGLQRVQFGTEEAEILDGATATAIKVIAPDLNKTGAVDVIVVRNFQAPSGGTAVLNSEAVAFTYAPLKPVILSINPNSGIMGEIATITGNNFENIKKVLFKTTEATLLNQSAGQLTVQIPNSGVVQGPVQVIVFTKYNVGNSEYDLQSLPSLFTYEPSLAIADFTPKIGKKDDLLTIQGTGFGTNANLLKVKVNGVSSEIVSITNQEIKIKVPSKTGVGKVSVSRGAVTAYSLDNFEYQFKYTVSTIFNNLLRPVDIDFSNFTYYIASYDWDPQPQYSITVSNGFNTGVYNSIKTNGGGIDKNGNYICIDELGNIIKFQQSTPPVGIGQSFTLGGSNDIKFRKDTMVGIGYQFGEGIYSPFFTYEKIFISDRSTFINGPIPAKGECDYLDLIGDTIIFTSGGARCIRIVYNDLVGILTGNPNNANGTDGNFSTATFGWPTGIVYAGNGTVYVADRVLHSIRRLDLNAQKVSLVAGGNSSVLPGFIDGQGLQSRFYSPYGICIDGDGNLLVADSENNAIRKITIE